MVPRDRLRVAERQHKNIDTIEEAISWVGRYTFRHAPTRLFIYQARQAVDQVIDLAEWDDEVGNGPAILRRPLGP
jgi:hypothetical protein